MAIVLSMDGREPYPFPLASHDFSGSWVIPHLFPRQQRPLDVHCTQSPLFLFLLPLDLPVAATGRLARGCSRARGGLFKLSLTNRELHLTIFLLQVPDRHMCKSGAVSRLTFSNNILNVQRKATTSAVLTVETDGNFNYPEFPRRVAASSPR